MEEKLRQRLGDSKVNIESESLPKIVMKNIQS
jgi:hypothetical protein